MTIARTPPGAASLVQLQIADCRLQITTSA